MSLALLPSRASSRIRLAVAAAALLLFAPEGLRAQSPVGSRFLLEPDSDSGLYTLPEGYTFDPVSCGSAFPGSRAGDTHFTAAPLASTTDFRGFNLYVWKRPAGCTPIQVLLLPKNLDRNAPEAHAKLNAFWQDGSSVLAERRRAAVTEAMPTRGERTYRGEGAVRVAAEDVPSERLERTAWYFASIASTTQPLEVATPTLDGKRYYACGESGEAGGATTIRFAQGEVRRKIQVTTEQHKCDTASTHAQIVIRSGADALALEDKDREPLTASLRLIPIDDDKQMLGVEVKDLFVSNREFRSNNRVIVDGFRASGPPRCGSTSCVFRFNRSTQLNAADQAFDVRIDSLTSRALDDHISTVLDKDGNLLTSANLFEGTVDTWNLGASTVLITIAPSPNSQTQIPIPEYIARLMGPKDVLDCTVSGKPEKACARFVSTQAGGSLVLVNANARKALASTGQSLDVSLGSSSKLRDADGKPVSLSILTDSCQFSFRQLTRTVAGLQGGEVLYRVDALPNRCLCSPVQLRSKEDSIGFGYSRWDDSLKDCLGGPPQARVLRTSISSIAPSSEFKQHQLDAALSSEQGSSSVDLLPNERGVALDVDPGLDKSDIKILPEISSIGEQAHLAAGVVNQVSIPRIVTQPWRITLMQGGNFSPALPTFKKGFAEIRVSLWDRVLPWKTTAERIAYFLHASRPSNDDLQLLAKLDGPVAGFLTEGAAAQFDGLDATKLQAETVNLGSQTVPVTSVKTKRFYVPWDLRDAALICGWRKPGLPRGVRVGDAAHAYKRSDLQRCWLRINVPSGLTPEDFKNRSPQRVTVTLSKSTNSSEQPVMVAQVGGPDATIRGRSLLLDLRNTLEKAGKVADYTQITFHARQPTDAELQTAIPDAYVPPSLATERQSEFAARTVIVPNWTCVDDADDGRPSYGWRHYFTSTANLSLVRSRSKGYGANTSSAYADDVGARFGYGLLYVGERWNFSDGEPIIPLLAPQLTVGMLGPTEFSHQNWWRDVSFVAGLGFRLPAATKTAPDKVEAQTGLVVWYEVSSGARDSWLQSILFGFNVSAGALTP